MFDDPNIQKLKSEKITLLLQDIRQQKGTDFYSYSYHIYLPNHYAAIGRITYRQNTPAVWADRGDIGYTIHRKHRRKGYAGFACRCLLTMLAANGVAQVVITCDKGHAATPRICKQLGGVFFKETHKKWYYLIPTQRFDSISTY